MRLALVGDHPDGLDMARALVESGHHELAAYTGSSVGADALRRRGLTFRQVGDFEESLADPATEAVIVAGSPADRPAQLRRALQSERHVLCVHPADHTPDIAYEAAMIQQDTRRVLLPLLPEALHPGVGRLAELVHTPGGPLGKVRLIEMERWSPEAVWIDPGVGHKPNLPGWDVLRALGGELAEVSAFAAADEIAPGEPVLLAGRFEGGRLFQATLVSGQHTPRWRLAAIGSYGQAELNFPDGWPGPARLHWRNEAGELCAETWDAWNPWPALVAAFESAVLIQSGRLKSKRPQPDWQSAIRCLELDDAARRSVHYRRVSALEYPEATEEAGFKGTMTLAGCGLLWLILLLLILANWFPKLGWAIVPLLIGFLAMQLLRWIVPRAPEQKPGEQRPGQQ
jgi:predicted dehydrogenase